jgi:hypothetical protein
MPRHFSLRIMIPQLSRSSAFIFVLAALVSTLFPTRELCQFDP